MAKNTLGTLSFNLKDFNYKQVLSFARRRRFFAISVVSWVVMGILAVAVLVPQVQKILARRDEIATAQEELDKSQTFVNGLEALNAAELTQTNTVLSASLPQEKPVLPLLYSLNRLAAGAQVSVSEFEISPGLLGTGSGKLDSTRNSSLIDPQLSALPLRMTVAGVFENLSTFFKSLDFVIPLIQITSIQFATSGNDAKSATTSGQYTAKVELSSLYMKTKPTIGQETIIGNLTVSDRDLIDKLSSSYAQREADNAQQTVESSASGRTNLFSSP